MKENVCGIMWGDKFEFLGEMMIILITGASHTGKTALAQKMLEKYKYPYLSIDHLKMGLIRSGNTELTPMDDNELIEYFSYSAYSTLLVKYCQQCGYELLISLFC